MSLEELIGDRSEKRSAMCVEAGRVRERHERRRSKYGQEMESSAGLI